MFRRTSRAATLSSSGACGFTIAACGFIIAACGSAVPGDAPATTGEPVLTAPWAPAWSPALRVSDTAVTVLGRDQLRVFDSATGALRWQAPPGVLSQDGLTAVSVSATTGGLTATVYDAATGTVRNTIALPANSKIAAISAGGDKIAVVPTPAVDARTELAAARVSTQIDIVATAPGSPTKSLTIAGNVVPEAFATSGKALFVLDYLPATHPDHYKVRSLDVATGRMEDLITRDKRPLDDQMQGVGGAQVASANGAWLFTLYREFGTDGAAFIHALNLGGYADCIDLPPGLGFDGGSLLASTNDGNTVYAISAQGTLVEIDNNRLKVNAARDVGVRNATALAVRGGTVAVASNDKVAVLTRMGFAELSSWVSDAPVQGLVLGGDDRTIVVSDGRTVQVVDVKTGAPIRRFAA